jgi:hypothetical protein
LCEVDKRQLHLLGERLGELAVGQPAELDEQAPELLAGRRLLKQRFGHLLVRDVGLLNE